MAQRDKATLKALFQTGDAPTGSDFEDLIDSQLNLAETTAQTVNGTITYAGGATFASLSAATVGGAQGTFSALNATAATIVTLSATNIAGLARAEMFHNSNGTCAFASISAFMPLTSMTTTVEAGFLQQFTHSGSGRLTYTGTANKVVRIDVSFETLAVTSLQIFELRLGLNGSSASKGALNFRSTTAQGTAPNAGHLSTLVTLTANTFVELFAAPVLRVSDVIFTRLNMKISEV